MTKKHSLEKVIKPIESGCFRASRLHRGHALVRPSSPPYQLSAHLSQPRIALLNAYTSQVVR